MRMWTLTLHLRVAISESTHGLYPHTLGRALTGPLSDTHESHRDGYASVNCRCPHHPAPAARLRPGIRRPLLTSFQHRGRAGPLGTALWPASASFKVEASPDSLPNEASGSAKPWASGIYHACSAC